MRLGTAGFCAARLVQARAARGVSQTALAQIIGRAPATVYKWESGDHFPELESLERISQVLGMPTAWFLKPLPKVDSVCFFRSRASATKRAREVVDIRLKWLNEIAGALEEWVELPPVNIPFDSAGDGRTLIDEEIEALALRCRQHWRLGLGPISDMLLVLENAGAICVREEVGYASMDGASRWSPLDDRPYVFLTADKANACRSRLDAAHELGHLVLHRAVSRTEFSGERYEELERQAFAFGGAFLMPADSFAAEVSRPSLDTFAALKRRWKVSIGAMIKRCASLGIVDKDYETRLWKNYSARGWRRGEPFDNEIAIEHVRLLPRAVNLLLSEGGLDRDGLVRLLCLAPGDCESLCGLPLGFLTQTAEVAELKPRLLRAPQVTAKGDGKNVIVFPTQKALPGKK
jgi:Zn-dependent peptidase ImmA (M78 family)/DNA-binding XRE family transcriptional regulator